MISDEYCRAFRTGCRGIQRLYSGEKEVPSDSEGVCVVCVHQQLLDFLLLVGKSCFVSFVRYFSLSFFFIYVCKYSIF